MNKYLTQTTEIEIIYSAEGLETEEKRICLEKCDGQMWDDGYEDFVNPCSSIIHSLSVVIIFIISLVL